MPNGSALEWVMFVVSSIGFVLTIYIRMIAVRDFRRAYEENWSYAARLVGEGNVYGETLNVVLSTICFFSGLIAVAVSPPPGPLAGHAQWKLVALTIVSGLVVIQGVRSLWYRRRILGLHSIREGPQEETAIHDFGRTSRSAH